MAPRRRRDADDADEEADVFEGGNGFDDDEDDDEGQSVEGNHVPSEKVKEGLVSATQSNKSELTAASERETKRTDVLDHQVDDSIQEEIDGPRIVDEGEAPGHPTFVPRNDRYFLHEDRRAEQGDADNEEGDGSNTREVRPFRFRADEVTAGHLADAELDERRELIDTDHSKSEGSPSSKWLHDRFDLLESDEPLPDAEGGFSNSFPHYRRGFRGGGFRGNGGSFRGFRGGFRGGRIHNGGSYHQARGSGFRGKPTFGGGHDDRDGDYQDRSVPRHDRFNGRYDDHHYRGSGDHEREDRRGRGRGDYRGGGRGGRFDSERNDYRDDYGRGGRGGYRGGRGGPRGGYHHHQHDDRDEDDGRYNKRFSVPRERGTEWTRGSRGGFRGGRFDR